MGVRTRAASRVSRQEGSTQVVREKVKLWRRGIPSTSVPTPAAAAKSLQSCQTLCDPRDGIPPGSTVPGILQARVLE